MRKIVCILLFMIFTNSSGMEKPGIIQAYKNWMYVQTIRHFTQPQPDSIQTRPLDRSRFIPLKQLHDALDWEIKKHVFMR